MKQITLEAQPREEATQGNLNAMRTSGRVPGVAYGDNAQPVVLSVDEKSLQAAIHTELGRNALINLTVGGSSHAVLVKEIQRHPITRAIRHVDFHRISLKKKIEALVPVHVKGEAPGVKLSGGVLEHLVRDVRVKCLPTEIPPFIDVDVSGLQINQAIRGKDLAIPAGVELLLDPEGVIIHVQTVHVVEETPVAAAGAEAAVAATGTAEPEVIKKGKVEEGAEGAAAPASAKASAGQPTKAEAKKPEGK